MTDATDYAARREMPPEERSRDLDFKCIECGGVNDQPQHWDFGRNQMWPEWSSCKACMAPYHAEKARLDDEEKVWLGEEKE